ncbi:hypothetical protein L1887_32001 [Cichorium endivia]|nr:hypothetical protein L1887_32001 [Cichorium endivia]
MKHVNMADLTCVNETLGRDVNARDSGKVLKKHPKSIACCPYGAEVRTGFIASSSRVFSRGVLVEDSWEIAKKYMSSYFLVDILVVLTLPQGSYQHHQNSTCSSVFNFQSIVHGVFQMDSAFDANVCVPATIVTRSQ